MAAIESGEKLLTLVSGDDPRLNARSKNTCGETDPLTPVALSWVGRLTWIGA